MNTDDLQALVADDMQRVDAFIGERLRSEVVLINQLSHYIVSGGGKRLRPRLVLLAAGAAGYRGDYHINIAAIIEFIHTATLLHDDVVDDSELRRGRDTANAVWGNEAAVLVGDFLYSRAFEMMVEVNSMRVMEILAGTTNVIAEGEVLQLLNINDPDTTEATYLGVIHAKTAKLFEAATRLGAVLAGLSEEQESALAGYGTHLGTAFQLVDDVLDFSASAAQMGKNLGDDLAEGKPTLPLILAMRSGNADQRELLRAAIEEGGREQIDAVITIVEATGSLDAALGYAEREAALAAENLQALPRSPYRDALQQIAESATGRQS
ncbi:MAG: octaprenyl diphosphate synthase [Pseudomonadota bacterium]